MSAVRIGIQFSEIRYQFGAKGVQVNIANQLQKIGVFLAQDGFIAVLKQMTMAPVAAIIRHDITGQQPTHHRGKGRLAGFKQQVHVVGH